MFDWIIYSPLKIENIETFKAKLRWSKSLRLLQSVAFLVYYQIVFFNCSLDMFASIISTVHRRVWYCFAITSLPVV